MNRSEICIVKKERRKYFKERKEEHIEE